MGLFADRLFDALAALVENERGQLHRLAGREPVEVDSSSVLSQLKDLGPKLANYPFLSFVHASKLLPHLGLCPTDTAPYLLHWLPKNLRLKAQKHLGYSAVELPLHPIARSYIINSWGKFIEAVGTTPELFAPPAKMPVLLRLTQEQLQEHVYGMALYAFEPLLKGFIDRKSRESIKQSLAFIPGFSSVDFIRYIQKNRKDLRAQQPYSFPIQLWDGSPESFKDLCERFGLACLARLIQQESLDFIEEIKLHVSDAFWAKIPSVDVAVSSELLHHLKISFETYSQYSKELTSSSTSLQSQHEEHV
jgi:hypothetical protein